jgi:hypothetical protein
VVVHHVDTPYPVCLADDTESDLRMTTWQWITFPPNALTAITAVGLACLTVAVVRDEVRYWRRPRTVDRDTDKETRP